MASYSTDPYAVTSNPFDTLTSFVGTGPEATTLYTPNTDSLTIPKIDLISSTYNSTKLSTNTHDIFNTHLGAHDWSSLPSSPVKLSHHNDFDTYKSSNVQSSLGGLLFAQNGSKSHVRNLSLTIDIPSNHPSTYDMSGDKNISNIGSIATSKADLNAFVPTSTLSLEYRSEIQDAVTVFDFLSKIKATDHIKVNELFLLATQYSQARVFPGSQQGIFLCLAFAFFERVLLGDPSAVQNDYSLLLQRVFDKNTDVLIGANKPSYKKFLTDFKMFLLDKDFNKGSALYNSICQLPDVYEASLLFFREILVENLQSYSSLVRNSLQDIDSTTFKWINDLKLSDATFYQEMVGILKASIKVLALTSTELEQKTFPYVSTISSHKSRETEVVVFHDKRDNSCYLLYLTKEQIKSQMNDIRSPVKHMLDDKRRGSLTPLGQSSISFEKMFDFSAHERIPNDPSDALLYPTGKSTESYTASKTEDIYGLKTSITLLDTIINVSKATVPVRRADSLDVQHLFGHSLKDITYHEQSPVASPIANSLSYAIGNGISPVGKGYEAAQVNTASFAESFKDKSVNSLVDQLFYDKNTKDPKPTSIDKVTSIGATNLAVEKPMTATDKTTNLTVEHLIGEKVTVSASSIEAIDRAINSKVEKLLNKGSFKPTLEDLLPGNTSSTPINELLLGDRSPNPVAHEILIVDQILSKTPKASTTTTQGFMASVDLITRESPKSSAVEVISFSNQQLLVEKMSIPPVDNYRTNVAPVTDLMSTVDLILNKKTNSSGHRSSSGVPSHKGSDNIIDFAVNEKSTTPPSGRSQNQITDIAPTEEKTSNLHIDLLSTKIIIPIVDNITGSMTPTSGLSALIAQTYSNPLAEKILREQTPTADSPSRSFTIRRTFPSALKDKFKVCGNEAESHETEFNQLTSKHLEEERKKEKVSTAPSLLMVKLKYNSIVNGKKK